MASRNPDAEPQWPPRSPHEVLLGTPGGRERLSRMAASRTSPSPLRRRLATNHTTGSLGSGYTDAGDEADGGDDDGEDEETLRLQLQEIQAKLRLKKLQASKGLKSWASQSSIRRPRSPPPPPASTVEVPASPIQRVNPAAADVIHKSPRRVLLGIDKGLRGQDVSLKRPPPASRRGLNLGGPAGNERNCVGSGEIRSGSQQQQRQQQEGARPLSFNERLAAARVHEAARQQKTERIQKIRSNAFPVGKGEMDTYKAQATDIVAPAAEQEKFSRDDILGIVPTRPEAAPQGFLQRSKTVSSLGSAGANAEGGEAAAAKRGTAGGTDAESFEMYSGFHLSRRILPHSVLARTMSGRTTYALKDLLRLVKAPDFELPDVETDIVVFAIVAAKSEPMSQRPGPQQTNKSQPSKYMRLTLVDLKFQVELYLFDSGFERFWKLPTGTVVAILNPGIMPPRPGMENTGRWSLAINSDADTILEIGTARDLGYCKSVKSNGKMCDEWVNSKRTKYCEYHSNAAIRLTRAQRNEINSSAGFGGIFGGGRGGRGRGSNTTGGHTYDPTKRRPKKNEGFDYDTQTRWFAAGGGQSASSLLDSDDVLGIGGGGSGSGGYADTVERREGIKRRLANKEREAEIARKLGQIGSGAGRDYMQLTVKDCAAAQEAQKTKYNRAGATAEATAGATAAASEPGSTSTPASAAAPLLTRGDVVAASRADLLAAVASRRTGAIAAQGEARPGAGKTSDSPVIHLGPVKRKRPPSSLSATATIVAGGKEGGGDKTKGFGWGSDLKAKLGRMREGETLALPTASSENVLATASVSTTGSQSRVRKKTRFLLGGKGIREAGRESLGLQEQMGGHEAASDDDDDLIII